MANPIGRPRVSDDGVRFTLRLYRDELAIFDAEAERRGIPRSQVLREALRVAGAQLGSHVEVDAVIDESRAAPLLIPPPSPPVLEPESCAHDWTQRKGASLGVVYECSICGARSAKGDH